MTTSPPRRGQPPEWADANCRAVLEAAPDAMLVVNRAGEIVAANRQAEKLYGYSHEHLIGSVVESLIPSRLRDRHRQHRENFFANPEIQFMQVLEIFAERSDASEFPVEVSLSRLTIGTETFAISAIRDATERRRAEELKRSETILRESEERFRLVADTAPVLIWMSGTDKLCTYFNKPWLDFTGRSIDEELGNGWAEGVEPEDLQRCLDTYAQSFDRREKFRMEYRLRRHDGEYRWVLDIGVPRFNQDRAFAGYIGIGVDVTEHKKAEEALRESEKNLADAEARAHLGSWVETLNDHKLIWSDELYRLWGLEPRSVEPGRDVFLRGVHPDDRADVHKKVYASLETRQPFDCVHRVLLPDSSVRFVHAKGETITNNMGQPVQFVGTILDITERKLAEVALANVSRKLIEAQEQERTRIGRELHDDIGQRLAMIAIELQQLNENSLILPEVRNRMSELQKQTSEIAADIQSLSHELHSAKLQYLGIAAAMRSFCKEFGEQQKVEIDFNAHDLSSPLSPDISLCLFRVLQESLHNSAKHSGVRHFEVRLWGTSDEIHLTVVDSGAGFDREAAKESRGLGLISMEERLRLVGGELSINSQPRSGTTIHARIPFDSSSDSARAAG